MAEAVAVVDIRTEQVAGSARAMLVVDDDCVCVEASLGACRLLGTTRDRLVGRAVESLLRLDSREHFMHAWETFRRGGGHAEPFSLEPPATVIEVAVTVTAEVLPSRHLIALDPVSPPLEAPADDGRPRRFAPAGDPPATRQPTAREREVLQLLAEGRTDAQIAELLELSPATVQTHVRNAKAKLGARTRAQAVAIALQSSLIEA
jgi:DNA-binding CsgD family transcriptional regulator